VFVLIDTANITVIFETAKFLLIFLYKNFAVVD